MSEHCPKSQLVPPCTASTLKLALQALRTRFLGWKTPGCHHHSPIAGEDREFRHVAVKLSALALKKWMPWPNTLRDEKAKLVWGWQCMQRRHGELRQLVFAMIHASGSPRAAGE